MARGIERRCLEWLFIINEKNTVNVVRMVTSFFLRYLVMKTFNNRATYSYLLDAHRASCECLSFRTSGTQLRRPLGCLCDIQGLSFFCLSLSLPDEITTMLAFFLLTCTRHSLVIIYSLVDNYRTSFTTVVSPFRSLGKRGRTSYQLH